MHGIHTHTHIHTSNSCPRKAVMDLCCTPAAPAISSSLPRLCPPRLLVQRVRVGVSAAPKETCSASKHTTPPAHIHRLSQYTVACFPALNNPQCQLQPRCPPARASLMSNKGHVQRVYVWADLMCVCVFKGTRGLALNPVTQLPLQSDGPKDPHQQMYRAATASRANRKKYHLRLSQSACVCRGSMCL